MSYEFFSELFLYQNMRLYRKTLTLVELFPLMAGSPRREGFDEQKFETAFQTFLQSNKKDYTLYIGGMKVASGITYSLSSPIDNTILYGSFQDPEKGTVFESLKSSLKTYKEWSSKTMAERAAYFESFLKIAEGLRYKLAVSVLISTGMTKSESMAEVDNMLDLVSEAVSEAVGLKGKSKGPWGIFTDHVSPLAAPIGYAAAAMIAGNTVIMIPSKDVPVPVYMAYEMLEKAGLPGGVMDIVMDPYGDAKIDLANQPELAGVVVSGSGVDMEDLMFLMIDDEMSFISELKGMNPIVIYQPKDMKRAVKNVLESAFSYNGQHLYSTSKVIVAVDDEKKFMDNLLEQYYELNIADPAETDVFSGPLVSKSMKEAYDSYINEWGAFMIVGGEKIVSEFTQNGEYIKPAIFSGFKSEDDVAYVDCGLPILAIKTVASMEEVLEELSSTECGLSVGVMTRDQKVVEMIKEEACAEQMFVNESSLPLRPGIHAKVVNFLK